ncbi:MAG: hypothetical protein K2Q23_01225 [Bryobacteraceae bacterium]|jgi:hypothetical protein|nr:hypothetical protein [Bryobacteraceae bacterium]
MASSIHPELASQLRFQVSLLRLCVVPHTEASVKPEYAVRQANQIEEMAAQVPARVAAKPLSYSLETKD